MFILIVYVCLVINETLIIFQFIIQFILFKTWKIFNMQYIRFGYELLI
jgi:hypothetical protein